ncbi:hypothetical protein GCM10010206_15150 [Streptomyces cinerochromogenes]|nr:hypothetical protein GCM10010206_15150 [Streptomyces cinerochromogenes]
MHLSVHPSVLLSEQAGTAPAFVVPTGPGEQPGDGTGAGEPLRGVDAREREPEEEDREGEGRTDSGRQAFGRIAPAGPRIASVAPQTSSTGRRSDRFRPVGVLV